MKRTQPTMTERKSFIITISLLIVWGKLHGVTDAQYNQYLFGASNYFGSGQSNQAFWWLQARCPWGTSGRGYRSFSPYQCGTFYCPSLWFGTTSYSCPMGTLYSNTLQSCVNPGLFRAKNCRRRPS